MIAGDTIARRTWKATRVRPRSPEGREIIADRTVSNVLNAVFRLTESMLLVVVTVARFALS